MAGMALSKDERRYTYDDYLTWPDEPRKEIINGVSYAMSSPTVRHQELSVRLTLAMGPIFKGKPCRLFVAPLDVVLSEDTVVQPDLLVVCDPTKITGACVRGAPDLAVEILSPSSSSHDRLLKFKRLKNNPFFWLISAHGCATLTRRFLSEEGFENESTCQLAE